MYDIMLKNVELYKTHYQEFYNTFKVSLKVYFNNLFGFDIIKFDEEFLKTPDGISTNDYLEKNYGEKANELVKNLLNYKGEKNEN